MTVIAIPKSLRERLGDEGSEGLVALISAIDERAREDSLRLLSERFERRLSEEIGKLRAEMHEEIGKLRAEMHEEIGSLRTEMGSLKAEMHDEIGKLRAEMHDEIGKLRVDMGNLRAELIKWMFIFWVGQIAVLGGLIVGLLGR